MFTGLIEDVGEVASLVPAGGGRRLRVRTRKLPVGELTLGESVAVDGCCLTVVHAAGDSFELEVSPETLARTSLGSLAPGTRVNLERAVRVGDRLGGHLVLGHVDGVGRLESTTPAGDYLELVFHAPAEVEPWLLPKGSVAIDGISLTVNRVEAGRFAVMIIPKTREETSLAGKSPGAAVNLEGDVIGKYVARLLGRHEGGARIDEEFLRRHGFA